MKLMRNVFIGIAALAMIICLSGMSFAKEGCGACCKGGMKGEAAKIKLMQDSAAALQQSNPALSKSLSDWAADEEKEMQECKEHKAKHEAQTKILTDAAAALKKTNPDLAKGLNKMAEKKYMGKKCDMMKEKNEKQ